MIINAAADPEDSLPCTPPVIMTLSFGGLHRRRQPYTMNRQAFDLTEPSAPEPNDAPDVIGHMNDPKRKAPGGDSNNIARLSARNCCVGFPNSELSVAALRVRRERSVSGSRRNKGAATDREIVLVSDLKLRLLF